MSDFEFESRMCNYTRYPENEFVTHNILHDSLLQKENKKYLWSFSLYFLLQQKWGVQYFGCVGMEYSIESLEAFKVVNKF